VSKIRVCFLGTPDFAVTCLKRILDDDHYEVVGVVTQPDRPSGRKMVLQPTPVKSLAIGRGIPVLSPESVNKDFMIQEISKWSAEVAIVVAFGQILSQKFLDSFRLGCVNVHASLLPELRGAAPIQRAIQQGLKVTGVALQKMVKELDAGDVIGIRKYEITDEMNAKELHDQLALLGADLLHVELMDYLRGNLAPVAQDHSKATYAKKIDKTEAELKWKDAALNLHNKIRAFVMGPGTWTMYQGKKLKVHRARVGAAHGGSKPAGTVLSVSNESVRIATGTGALEILEVQPDSRNRMNIEDFLKGYAVKEGDLFG